MSLFKARDFWTTICDTNEQFDQNSLKKSKLGGDDDYIITGSHSGVLRVFKPSSEVQEDGKVTGFKASDLVIEKTLSQPILQVADGRLISYVLLSLIFSPMLKPFPEVLIRCSLRYCTPKLSVCLLYQVKAELLNMVKTAK